MLATATPAYAVPLAGPCREAPDGKPIQPRRQLASGLIVPTRLNLSFCHGYEILGGRMLFPKARLVKR